MTDKMQLTSMDIAVQRRAELKALFPSVFTETKDDKGNLVESIDFEKLKAELGTFSDVFEARRERYGLEWPGKKECIRLIQQPSLGTLKPCRNESVQFDATQNLFIEGDNLEVLKLLQKSYFGKIKVIYIDPPYNTGKEFIYPDNYAESLDTYLAYSGLADSEGRKFSTNASSEGRFHTKWMNMMYPRLYLARNLLTEDGVIFISIDDHEVAALRKLCDEIFGEENLIGTIIWKGATDNNPTQIAVEHEYVLCYARAKGQVAAVWKSKTSDAKTTMLEEYERLKGIYGDDIDGLTKVFRKFVRDNAEVLTPLTHYTQIDGGGPYTGSRKVHNPKPGGYVYDVIHEKTGKACVRPANGYRYPEDKMKELLDRKRILFGDDESQIIQIKEYLADYEDKLASWIVLDSRAGANEIGRLFPDRKVFTNPKPFELLARVFGFVLDDGDIMLDFFAGSCSSAQAVLEMNAEDGKSRRFIAVQLPERLSNEVNEQKPAFKFCVDNDLTPTIAEIAKQRIRRCIEKLSERLKSEPDLFSNGNEKLSFDLGVRILKLDRSNFRAWQGVDKDSDDTKIVRQLEMHVDHVIESATAEDILYELLLKAGFQPTEPVERRDLAGTEIFAIAEGSLLICLENEVTRELIDAVAEAEPMQFICLDKAFKGNDQLKANAVQTFAARNQGREKAEQIIFRTV